MAKAQQVTSAKAAAKKRVVKVDAYGDAHISASFNNIIISITNKNGQLISWSSAGKMGFKGSKKSTSFAATVAAAANPEFVTLYDRAIEALRAQELQPNGSHTGRA